MSAMPLHGNVRRAAHIAYGALALLFLISLTNRIRSSVDGLDGLLHGTEHVRGPFQLGEKYLDFRLSDPQPEARAVGIGDGDLVTSIGGRPAQGYTDFYSVLRRARPGDRLQVQVRSSTRKDVSIELQPLYARGPKAYNWLYFLTLDVAIPYFCLALGFWVAAVRIRDKRAWLLLLLMLSFPEFAYGRYLTLYGRDDLLQPIFAAYHQLLSNIWPAALLLFAIYFPERFDLDRKVPWAKWLIVGPMVLRVSLTAIYVVLRRHHMATALEMARTYNFFDWLPSLWFAAVVLFFAILGYKTLTASGRDSRRRLLLLDTAAAVGVTPIVVWLILRGNGSVEWLLLPALMLLFLFPVAMAYVIVVHRAMDVRVVIRQGLRYLLATGGIKVLQVVVSIAIIVMAATIGAGQNINLAQRIVILLFE
jgi:phosphoserine phosphatase RsbU/P